MSLGARLLFYLGGGGCSRSLWLSGCSHLVPICGQCSTIHMHMDELGQLDSLPRNSDPTVTIQSDQRWLIQR